MKIKIFGWKVCILRHWKQFFAKHVCYKRNVVMTNIVMKGNNMGYIEETKELKLDFKKIANMKGQEVIPVAIQNADTDEVILVAYTNEAAFQESVKLRRLVLWSTSRNELWHKGKTSGNEFELLEVLVNCEQNSLVYKVRPLRGNICHTSYNGVANNCFYRRLDMEHMELVNKNESGAEAQPL